MLRKDFIHGFAAGDWESAKAEAKEIMISRARVRGMIPYSELANNIRSIRLGAHDQRFFHFLGEISQEEDAAGRGLLTVLVVHRSGDMQPGPGFYELAKLLGRDTTDLLRCWIEELHRVHAVWGK
ncbi:hypothetical protein [Neorhizobium vignae]|uniref:hypothetical protein n=1 Tax=Neorhizobium vignae TaxID=690585 RepID=UPI000569B892|nr:hypothetical protein [Neorhizobium vignae]